jgi:hypothetical protein
VTVASTTTQLDAEANLTYDGAELNVGGTSAKLVLDQGSGDGYIFELRSTDVAHGISGYNTNTYGQFMKKHPTSGMLQIWGFSDADANQAIGLSLVGVSGIAANATKTTSAIGIVEINAGIKSGSGIANSAANGNLLVVRDAASGAAKVVVDQDGDVTLPIGNLVIGTAGKGIDFSAQSSPGAGMTSELLDRYEEGTWSPYFDDAAHSGGQTFSQQLGKYTRIGDTVWFQFRFTLTSLGSLTGGASYVAGLPFAKLAGSDSGGGHVLYYYGMSWAGAGNPSLFIEGTNSYMEFYGATATTGMLQIPISQFNNNSLIMGVGKYFVIS